MSEKEVSYFENKSSVALERLFNAPVKLASSSAYRRDQLVVVGFKQENISTVAMPDEEENKVQQRLKEEKYGRGISAGIAAAKVGYLAERADPGDMVIGMDTLPVFFAPEPTDERLFTPGFFNKPENAEDAKRMIQEAFTNIVAGYRNYMTITGGSWGQDDFSYDPHNDSENDEMTSSEKHYTLIGNYRSATVRVETGVAIRFPHESKVDSFVSAVTLLPRALYRIAQTKNLEEQQGAIDALVEKVMNELGSQSLKITGAVNWGNKKVRTILDVQEYLPHSDESAVEKGVYLGAPEKAIKDFLLKKFKTPSR